MSTQQQSEKTSRARTNDMGYGARDDAQQFVDKEASRSTEGNVPPAGGFATEDQAKAAKKNQKGPIKKKNPETSDEANNYMYQDMEEKPSKD